MPETDCRHCGHRIVMVSGTGWTHQPAGASFQDGAHIYCHTTTAEPRPAGRTMVTNIAKGSPSVSFPNRFTFAGFSIFTGAFTEPTTTTLPSAATALDGVKSWSMKIENGIDDTAEPGAIIWTCDQCGKRGRWEPGWTWFGSHRQMDLTGKPEAVMCSPACRTEHATAKGVDPEVRP